MSSHSQLPKQYEDKAVQTDPAVLSRVCDALSSASPGLPSRDPSDCLSMFRGSDPENDDENNAYMRSQAQAQALRNSDKRPPLLSSRPARKIWLEPARPSALDTVSSNRVVSFPDILSPRHETLVEEIEKLRIVSMPERGGRHSATGLGGGFFQNDNINTYERSRDPNHDRPYPSDLPQTPSPPSSPDSVVIIGNESHVPESLHRRSYSADRDGWITWANSPPRPIPALHGPLSLPYARCPSGAEGTVTEGDDLSNRIWGLGIDDSQNSSRSTRNNNDSSAAPSTLGRIDHREPQPPSQRQRDAIIDLAMPSTFYDRLAIPANVHSRRMSLADAGTSFASQHNSHGRSQAEVPLVKTHILPGTSSRDVGHPQAEANSLPSENMGIPLGLGFKWNTLTASGGEGESRLAKNQAVNLRQTHLNSAAPVFIPENIVYRTRSNAYSRHSEESRDRPYLSRDLPTMDISRQYRAQQDYTLPTPPSSSSPRWSPVFSRLPDPGLYESVVEKNLLHALPNQQDPRIYSPRSDLDDYSRHLVMLMQQIQMGREAEVIHETSAPLESVVFQGESALNVARYSAPSTPQIPPAALKKSLPQPASDIALALEDQSRPTAAGERRRNLSYQHPRSIPLARLIQRRLSSVAEEDISGASLDYNMSMLKSIHTKLHFGRKGPVGASKIQQEAQSQAIRATSGCETEARKKDDSRVDALNLKRGDIHQPAEKTESDASGPACLPRKQSGGHPRTTDHTADVDPSGGRGAATNDSSFEKENEGEAHNQLPSRSRPDPSNRKRMRYKKRGSNPTEGTSSEV